MRYLARPSFLQIVVLVFSSVLFNFSARAQLTQNTDRNTSKMANYQNECAITKNPLNHFELFAACNNSTGGLFAARSNNLGVTWTYPDADKTIADGDANQGPLACCDPTLAWDNFGNLFITYLGDANTIETLLSTDGGATFTNLATFGPASVDQPTVVANSGAVWVVWNQSGSMRARGAAVTGLGVVAPFNPIQNIPNTANCSFGDIAIAPSGAVVQVCETPVGGEGPATLRVNTDADGLGAGNFNAGVAATTTNVGGFDFIPAQAIRSVDAEAGLAYDRNQFGDPSLPGGLPSPHFGRLYLVYTEETAAENNDLDIMVRFSDDDGGTWSAAIRVNDDATVRSQFLPRIASNPLSGNIAVCWHDARNSGTNTVMEEFCTIATPTGAVPTFMANLRISDGASAGTGSAPPEVGQNDIQFGDYSGLTYFQGRVHPIWADVSNSTGDNPDGTSRWDAYTDIVMGGTAANEGDPHIRTVDGVNYDFQSAAEYIVLRDADGMQIQTRQSAVATDFFPGANPHTGLATCASLNSAVAARVGGRRVTFQPNLSGVPDPSGLQLRVDGVLTTLDSDGLDLGSGGRIEKVGNGIIIDFPNGTVLLVTPHFWSSQNAWYLNVNVSHTPAVEGIMGAIAKGSWLPRLPNGTSMGPRPASLSQRYNDLYQTFGGAWQVTNANSLFDYAPGTSTATFTLPGWPKQSPPCTVPDKKPAQPLSVAIARRLCRLVVGKDRNANCVFDVTVTGEPGFAESYLLTQRIVAGATAVHINDNKDPTQYKEPVIFTATVARKLLQSREAPTGTVQFILDGKEVGQPITLDKNGRAVWRTAMLEIGEHKVTARYRPRKGSAFMASTSVTTIHTVRRGNIYGL